jgi:hypothetical protein
MLPRTLRADSGVSFGVVGPSALETYHRLCRIQANEPVLLTDKSKAEISFAFRTHEAIKCGSVCFYSCLKNGFCALSLYIRGTEKLGTAACPKKLVETFLGN